MSEDIRIEPVPSQEAVDRAQSDGVFSFAEVLEGRSYPRDEVQICIDEDLLYRLKKARADGDENLVKQLEEKKAKSTYTLKLVGVSSEKREELEKIAEEKFPRRYEQIKNFKDGTLQRQEVPSEERADYNNDLLWATQIEQIIAPDGRVDTAPGVATARKLRKTAPLGELIRVQQAIVSLVMTSDVFERKTDAQFPGGDADKG